MTANKILSTLQTQEDRLNQINVFPIADGDTGKNLIKTLLSIKDLDLDFSKDSFNKISENLLNSARGSSGNILALYFLGLAQNFNEDLTKMCKAAADLAWNTISGPIEGTILTAMKNVPLEYSSNIDFLEKYIDKGLESLVQGPDILPILKAYQTLDSGTLGWLYILDGIYQTFTGISRMPNIEVSRLKDISLDTTKDSRYCTEVLLETQEDIKSLLKDLGNELIVLTLKERVKLHIHTDSPEKVLEICKQNGKILETKIDDMEKQKND